MVPLVLAGLLGVGLASLVGIGLAVMAFRRRPMRIVDYPELPAPPSTETAERKSA